MNAFNDINKRLDDTIRRYYRWRIVRGLLIWAIVLFVPWMLLAMGAFYTWIGSGMRLLLLVLYVLLNLTVLGLGVLVPWLRLNGGLPRMTRREAALRIGAGSLLESITLFDRYDQIGDGKVSLAFTLTFRASDRTLTADEVASYRDQAVTSTTRLCGATLRG